MVDVKELNKIKDTLLSKMKELFKKDGKIDSMGIVVDKDGTVAFVPMPYRDNQEKLIMIDGLKSICRKHSPAAVVIINEAWSVVRPQDDFNKFKDELKSTGKSIKDLPDKKEIAIMFFETNFNQEIISFDIERPSNNLVNETRNKNATGIFSNLLTPVDLN